MSFLFGLFKLVPLKDWLYIAAIVTVLILAGLYNHHEREIGRQQSAAVIATLQAQLAQAQQANAGNDAAVKELQAKLDECKHGREVDKAAQDDAQKAYAASLAVLKDKDAAAHQRTAKLLAGDCKAWASQPACGVTVTP